MILTYRSIVVVSLSLLVSSAALAQTLMANSISNNAGATGWAMFFDLMSNGRDLAVTSLSTASTATAGVIYSVDLYTRSGTSLGGPVGTGPGSSMADWTSLGRFFVTQGDTPNGISLPLDIPDIPVSAGSTVGVAMRFIGVGPRYFGSIGSPLQTFTDGPLTLVSGDARSAPFSTTGSYIPSRGLTGSLTYEAAPVPEPASAIALLGGIGILMRRRSLHS